MRCGRSTGNTHPAKQCINCRNRKEYWMSSYQKGFLLDPNTTKPFTTWNNTCHCEGKWLGISSSCLDLYIFLALNRGRGQTCTFRKGVWQQRGQSEVKENKVDQVEGPKFSGELKSIASPVLKLTVFYCSFWICCLGGIALIFCWTGNKI